MPKHLGPKCLGPKWFGAEMSYYSYLCSAYSLIDSTYHTERYSRGAMQEVKLCNAVQAFTHSQNQTSIEKETL